MKVYRLPGIELTSLELKCLLVSRGVKCDKAVYRRFGGEKPSHPEAPGFRLNVNPLTCNCLILPDGVICQMTDVGFHLEYLGGALSWDNLKLLRYASQLGTPFSVRLDGASAALYYERERERVCEVTFAPYTDFYRQKTASGLPFVGNAVLQGLDWVSFQCLWHCEFGESGKPCQFCFSGAEFEANARRGKPQPSAVSSADAGEIVRYALENAGVSCVQITGGSTFDGKTESEHIRAYLTAIQHLPLTETLLYITPPDDTALIDEYFSLGATRIACSLEVWDYSRAAQITPGKIAYTTRKRHIDVLTYIAEKYGRGKAFSNFIIGLEDFDTLKDGAERLAARGILPSASVWMPMGRPVMGSMTAPDLDYYRRVIDMLAELYERYSLEPPLSRGLNVCIERDIWNWSRGTL
ncbi:MAG: hypothetical protein LBS51_05415 [Oscillospiraceae bacterium]|jgi:hypothetical protein|nr:hypothetical protein [Oscillospiraceae bacterium]